MVSLAERGRLQPLSKLTLAMSDSHAHESHSYPSDKPLLIALTALLLAYAVAVGMGLMTPHEAHNGAAAAKEVAHTGAVLPFVMLLGAIAVFPLIESTAHWWDHNHNKLFVAAGLGLITLAYLALGHPAGGFARAGTTLSHVIVQEYVPFIILLFSLYTICGGIRIAGDLPAHATTNTKFIAAGGLLASFIGTTGAAMLLIRPLLETNRERKHVAHTVVFFIFVVCNCGGLLLPIGDPPLFLGYLSGVPFLWTLKLWPSWLLVNGLLLAVYFAWDHFAVYPRETKSDLRLDETRVHKLRFSGLWPNALLLLGVVLAVGLLDSSKPFPGTNWQPWFYLREAVQLGLVAISLLAGAKSIRVANSFNYVAIIEVACLFVGIFVCMQPALEILNARGGSLGINTPQRFFWASGFLSSVLDNAPTYLVFFEAAKAISFEGATIANVSEPLLIGISLGSVCMGAMTYIGNGPNFMVKTIAEKSDVKMPSFFGYMIYSFVVLLPILVLNTFLFLK
jgi:Na+/H+ antiporter NhaD/arsenite permease-like protein